MNTIYLKTAKARHEGTKLPGELKRVLSLLDGRSGSDDLAKRAAPSLRKMWGNHISELLKRGYIVSSSPAEIEPKDRPVHKSGATDSDYQKIKFAAEQVIAILEAAEEADKAKSDSDAKAKADAHKKAESTAHNAELKAFFAAAKEKAAAEIKQLETDAAPTRTEVQPATELETPNRAAKTRPDIVEKSKSKPEPENGMRVNDIPRRDLEIENKVLKKLLVEAYVEIAALKAALEKKA